MNPPKFFESRYRAKEGSMVVSPTRRLYELEAPIV
jgi:hypothetical protein